MFADHYSSIAEGRDVAKLFNCKHVETSAKQRINVDEAFYALVREIRNYNKASHLLVLPVNVVRLNAGLLIFAGSVWSRATYSTHPIQASPPVF